MGVAFTMLQANDLGPVAAIRAYYAGERDTRMTDGVECRRTHAGTYAHQYRGHVSAQRLCRGAFAVRHRARPWMMTAADVLVVGTERDHIAPWHSVFKPHR
jgi:polyhydroxyalkanoate synthase